MSRARDLANGTFSGAFSADSPTLVVDAANNRVGVGTASPDATLKVVSSGSNLLVGYSGTQNYLDASQNIFRNFSGTEAARIDDDGLKFNGDTAAANALDDYEEGDIDISTMYFETSGSATAHSANTTLRYVKIGNQVTITGNLFFSSVTSQNGPLKIPLPFSTSASGQKLRTIGVIGNYQSNTPTIVKIENNASYGLMLYPNGWSSVPISAQQTYVLNVTYLAA